MMKIEKPLIRLMGVAASALILSQLVACSDDGEGGDDGAGGQGGDSGAESDFPPAAVGPAQDAAETYAKIVTASYLDSLAAAKDLEKAVETLVEDPTESHLEAAKQAWLASREPYLQTEVFRFYDGPIDNEDNGPEGLLNAWPLDEAYIDYVTDDETAGIINDTDISIEADALESLNEQGGETNIATGYHAVEFLLWGQDQSKTGPGERPVSDYDSADNADRRGKYLTTVTGQISVHLSDLVEAWATGTSDNYRAEWQGLSPDESMRRMLTGMIILSGFETGGERLQTALDSGDQEDEHSCFSDNTHRDMIQDIQGVLNVWTGTYKGVDGDDVDGPGIFDAVFAVDEDLAQELDEQIKDSLAKANALRPPFDQEIASGNSAGQARVRSLVQALQTQEKILQRVFRLFQLDVPVAQ